MRQEQELPLITGTRGKMKENGKIVRCEKCGSDKIVAVHPFDYVKMCMNDDCPYHVNHPKGWRWQFVTGVHN